MRKSGVAAGKTVVVAGRRSENTVFREMLCAG